MGSGTEACSACSLGLLSLECSGVGQDVYRGKQSEYSRAEVTNRSEVVLAGATGMG